MRDSCWRRTLPVQLRRLRALVRDAERRKAGPQIVLTGGGRLLDLAVVLEAVLLDRYPPDMQLRQVRQSADVRDATGSSWGSPLVMKRELHHVGGTPTLEGAAPHTPIE
jgi:hypothetical protein